MQRVEFPLYQRQQTQMYVVEGSSRVLLYKVLEESSDRISVIAICVTTF